MSDDSLEQPSPLKHFPGTTTTGAATTRLYTEAEVRQLVKTAVRIAVHGAFGGRYFPTFEDVLRESGLT